MFTYIKNKKGGEQNMLKKVRKSRAIASVGIALMAFQLFAGVSAPSKVQAASITSASDSVTREKINEKAGHTITFVSPTGISTNSDTMTLTWDSSWTTVSSVAAADVGLTFSTGTYSNDVASSNGAGQWGYSVSGNVMTFTAPTDENTNDTLTGGDTVTITIAADKITNSSSATSAEVAVVVGASNGDSGEFDVPIMDDDQVDITASVDTYITFDLDIADGSKGDSDPGASGYALDLGELTYGTATTSSTPSVDEIWFDLASNASNGVAVQVKTGNTSGLVSTADSIPFVSGNDNQLTTDQQDGEFGISALSETQGTGSATLTAASAYDNSGVDYVSPVTTTFADIYTANGAIYDGVGQIGAAAVAGKLTAAADDYSNTLTFRATATF